jgi:hypothetical protein
MVIDLSDRSRTLNRNGEHFCCCLGINPHNFTFTLEPNGVTKVSALRSHHETHRSMLRDHGRGFEKQPTDTYVPADGFELNHSVSGVNLHPNRVVQAEATILAV